MSASLACDDSPVRHDSQKIVEEGESIHVTQIHDGAESVVSAWYGNKDALWGEDGKDVTEKVKELLRRNQPLEVRNEMFGSDPLPGIKNALAIRFKACEATSIALATTPVEKKSLGEYIALLATSTYSEVLAILQSFDVDTIRRLELVLEQTIQDKVQLSHHERELDETTAIEIVAPMGPPPAASRPFRPLQTSCLDISDVDDTQDCLNLSGAPRKVVPTLRQKRSQPKSPSKPKKAPVEGEPTEEEMQWELVLSARATQETALIEVLQTREFTLDEYGRVEIDDHMQAGVLARRRAELPGDLSFEDIGSEITSDPMEIAKSPRSRAPRKSHRVSSGVGDDLGVSYDTFCDWYQRQVHLNFIRQSLQEQSVLGSISASIKSIVTSPGGNLVSGSVPDSNMIEPIPLGSEPPPSPALQRRRRDVSDEAQLDVVPSGVDDRYLHACSELGLHSKPMVLKALRAVEGGSSSLPPELTQGSYLGDRGAQAFFQTLAGDDCNEVNELRDMRTLDLHGQGIGNDAAAAVAQFLPRCPHLRVLNLSKNHISELGMQKLMEEVQVHPSLDVLNIDMNPVPSWQRVRLQELLQSRRDFSAFGLKTSPLKGVDAQQFCRH